MFRARGRCRARRCVAEVQKIFTDQIERRRRGPNGGGGAPSSWSAPPSSATMSATQGEDEQVGQPVAQVGEYPDGEDGQRLTQRGRATPLGRSGQPTVVTRTRLRGCAATRSSTDPARDRDRTGGHAERRWPISASSDDRSAAVARWSRKLECPDRTPGCRHQAGRGSDGGRGPLAARSGAECRSSSSRTMRRVTLRGGASFSLDAGLHDTARGPGWPHGSRR